MNKQVAEFQKTAEERWQFFKNKEIQKGNRRQEKLARIAKELHEKNELEELEVLLDDPNDAVRMCAAASLLVIGNVKAEETLEELSKKTIAYRGDITAEISFCSEMVLKVWRMGTYVPW